MHHVSSQTAMTRQICTDTNLENVRAVQPMPLDIQSPNAAPFPLVPNFLGI